MSKIDKANKADGIEEKKPVNTNGEGVKNTTSDLKESVSLETSNQSANADTHKEVKETSTKVEPNEDTPNNEDVITEIETSNAEDAEDDGNKDRHTITVKEYDKMSLEALTAELETLIKTQKIQAIKSHVDSINSEFKTKFQALLDEKKSDFLNNGGNEIDFFYSSPIQKRYKATYKEYRNKLNEHYKSLEKNLKQNLADKLQIIEELKGLVNLEENINTTYKHFKELQERWRNTTNTKR